MDEPVDLPLPEAPPGEVSRLADAILDGGEYRPPARSPLERAFDWVGDRLGDFIGALAGGGRGSLVGIVFLVAATAFVLWLVIRRGSFRVGSPTVVDRPSLRSEIDERIAPEVWFAEADRLEDAGDFRGVIRCRYQGVVETLRQRALVASALGRTAGEFRADLLTAPAPLQDSFGDLADRFLDAWYGGRPVGPEDGAATRRLAQTIVQSRDLVGVGR